MYVEEHRLVPAHRTDVWRVVADLPAWDRLLAGTTRWEVVDGRARGCGARYKVRIAVGSAEVGGEIEVVEHTPPSDLAWSSVTGVEHRGRWRLREAADGTSVSLRLSYRAPGGLLALVADRLAAVTVRRDLRTTLDRLTARVAAGA